jgi:Phasin protein
MSTTQQGKPGGKNRQRNRKADKQDRKPEPQPSPMLDQRDEDQIDAIVASTMAATEVASTMASTEVAPTTASTDAPTIIAATPAEKSRIGIGTIAIAYGDYARKSFQDSGSFVEKLMGVRSLDKAIEVQTEFATQCYANLVAESQRIAELYRQLARQMLAPWGLAARSTDAGSASWTAVTSQSQH